MEINIEQINITLKGKQPQEIVTWALQHAKRPVLTTNFRPFEASILHLVTRQKADIPVIWCDSGYNTPETYRHAEQTIKQLNLNIDLFVPQQTVAHRNVVLGIPEHDTREHRLFTEQVKLEPFKRAMAKHQPDVWFTNLRKGQTAYRDTLGIVNMGKDGVLKVCPFFYWDDEQLNDYLTAHQLASENNYYDPTKVLANRECGLHA